MVDVNNFHIRNRLQSFHIREKLRDGDVSTLIAALRSGDADQSVCKLVADLIESDSDLRLDLITKKNDSSGLDKWFVVGEECFQLIDNGSKPSRVKAELAVKYDNSIEYVAKCHKKYEELKKQFDPD